MTSLIANQRFYNSAVSSNLINLKSSMASSKDTNNNNHNLGEMMSTSTSTLMTRPLTDIVDRKVLHHGDILGPIPNLFKWLHNELQRIEKNLQSSLQTINPSNSASNTNNTIAELALIKEEQNMEIVFYNQQYYFEVVRTFRVQKKSSSNPHDQDAVGSTSFNSKLNQSDVCGGEKPKAWFCKDIEERIAPMRPAQTWLNGKELFCCLLCNHFSFYSNHLMLHMMFDCPKRISQNNNTTTTCELSYLVNNNDQQHHQSSIIECSNKTKQQPQQLTSLNSVDNQKLNSKQHRSFDIMSLLNNKNDVQQNHNHHNHHNHLENKNKNQQSILSITMDLDKDLDEELVDVETLDSIEEPVMITTNIQQMKTNTILSKKQLMQQQQIHHHQNLYSSNHQAALISHNHSKEPTMIMRKYNGNNNNLINRKYSNKAANRSDSINALISSGNNKSNNKSAFKKFRNPKNSSINNKNTGNNTHNQQSSFISNSANLNNFYNQLSTSTNGITTSTINHPLFSFANLFRNTTNNSNPNQNQVTNQFPSSNTTTESIPLISQLYPFISNNNSNQLSTTTDGSIQNQKLPVAVSPSSGQQHPTSNLLEASNTIISSSAANNICHTAIGNCSLESNSPTLSFESSNSERNSPTTFNDEANKEKSIDDSEPSSMIQLLPQSAQSTMANNPLFNLPPYFMPPTSTAASNPLITSLYLLSPSLTALSYQASNVCAYCNTAFRMTSDLVYHMRSHHKRTQATDNVVNKKRRDDQLRCHICNETFRERHHLTRHMTSHQ